MKRRILVLMTIVALMIVMLALSVAPAFAAKDGGPGNTDNDPAAHSCGLNDPNAYKDDKGKYDEGLAGARELGLEENKPLEAECAPGK